MRTYVTHTLLLAFAAAFLAVAAAPAAQAQDAYLQVVNDAPDSQSSSPAADTVDVYFADTLAINNLPYIGNQSLLDSGVPYDTLRTDGTAMDLKVDFAPQGAGSVIGESLESGESFYTDTFTLQPGEAYLAVAQGVVDPSAYEDNPDGVPVDFQVQLLDGKTDSGGTVGEVSDLDTKVIHGSPDTPTIDAAVRGEPTSTDLVEDASYTDATSYLGIPVQNAVIDVTTGDSQTILGSFNAPLSLLGAVLPDTSTAPSLSVYASGFVTPGDEARDAARLQLIAVSSTGTIIPLGPLGTNDLLISEFLADPASGPGGDANNDNTTDSSEDEFVEIVNTGSNPISLDGFEIADSSGVKHEFPAGTTVMPGKAITVFGGGDPQGIPGTVQTASSGALGLDDDGDALIVRDPDFVPGFLNPSPGDSLTYGDLGGIEANNNVSVSRQRLANVALPEIDTGYIYTQTSLLDGDGDLSTGPRFTPGETIVGEKLPVDFAGQPAARVEGRDVTLTWRTLSETNSAGFYVEYQRDGQSRWRRANPAADDDDARVPSKAEGGTSSAAHAYSYTARDLTSGRYRFRVRQVDTDDEPASVSPEVQVEVSVKSFVLRGAYPNPLRPGAPTTLEYNAPEGEPVEAVLFNSLGQKVRRLEAGSGGRIEVEAGGLASGLYFVRLKAGERTAIQPVTLVR